MKKNNISIDIIAFGDPSEETVKKLTEFNEAVKSGDGSYLGVIPPGPNLLSDTLLATPLLANEGVGGHGGSGGAGGGAGEANDNQFEFGFNPESDPELALALRMSYEEEKARQDRETKAKEEAEAKQKLDDIPEADEKHPLLSEEGGNAEGSGPGSLEGENKKDKKPEDDDKMDIA
jgi:26S proteasome regulatory subunit N10